MLAQDTSCSSYHTHSNWNSNQQTHKHELVPADTASKSCEMHKPTTDGTVMAHSSVKEGLSLVRRSSIADTVGA